MVLPISLTFAGALALLNLWLAYRCIRLRMSGKVLIGDGDDLLLRARMRAQANFIEYTPFVLILMALIELGGGARTAFWGVGIVYVVVRLCHALGLERGTNNALRGIGAMGTFTVMAGLAVWAIVIANTVQTHAETVQYL